MFSKVKYGKKCVHLSAHNDSWRKIQAIFLNYSKQFYIIIHQRMTKSFDVSASRDIPNQDSAASFRLSIPRTMVYDNGSQVIKMTILSAQSRPSHAAHGERGHVEGLHREIHLRVHLRAIGIAPPKSFNVKAQHLERASATCEHRSPVFHVREAFLCSIKVPFSGHVYSCTLYRPRHARPADALPFSKIRATSKKKSMREGVKSVTTRHNN